MLEVVERSKVRFLVWFRWKLSERKMIESLCLFENTEDDSAWQLLRACEQLTDATLRAELFNQVMEETFHAEEFRRVHRLLTGKKMEKLSFEKKPLVEDENAHDIFIHCWVGEESAAQRFKNIALSLEPGPLKSMLERVVSDEIGHIHKAQELLQLLPLSSRQLQFKKKSVQIQRAIQHWLRMGRVLTDFVANLFLDSFYYAIAGLFAKPAEQKGLQ